MKFSEDIHMDFFSKKQKNFGMTSLPGGKAPPGLILSLR